MTQDVKESMEIMSKRIDDVTAVLYGPGADCKVAQWGVTGIGTGAPGYGIGR